MKKNIKILILLLTTLIVTSTVNMKASSGYTYDHKGQPIYSTAGFTINQLPFLATDLGIDNANFKTPEDLFIYTNPVGAKSVYIVDSTSNNLYLLNDKFLLQNTINKFLVDTSRFTDAELAKIKSSGNFVIARDTVFTIPTSSEKINLAVNDSIVIDYELATLDYDYELVWTSSDETSVTLVDNAGVLTIKAIAENTIADGATKVTGKLVKVELVTETDEDGVETQVYVRTDMAQVNIEVSTNPGLVLVADSKNHSFSLNELRGAGSFYLHLKSVVGVYRALNPNTGKDYIYLSDKGNNQVVILDSLTYEVVQIVTAPEDVSFEGRTFSPKEIITDGAGRLYVIADNITEGIMQFSKEGVFNRFVGVNYVTLSPWEIFWRNLSTDEQLAKQTTIINTSFTALAVDSRGFMYATSYALKDDKGLITNDNAMIKKINTAGKDVLRRNGYQPPKGDAQYVRGGIQQLVRGPSKFSAIAVNDYGMYTVVDKKMGKLFTYDNEGRLLYVSGEAMYIEQESGKQINTLSNPVAISYLDENLVVLDKNSSAIIVYEQTDIGALINDAAKLEFSGDNKTAATVWEQVVKLNANYEYGYVGIGKMYMNEKDYKKAMFYFERGENRELYSKAYKLHRDGQIRRYFGPVIGTVLVLVVAKVGYNVFFRKNKKVKADDGYGDE